MKKVHYVSAKHGVLGLMRALALELAGWHSSELGPSGNGRYRHGPQSSDVQTGGARRRRADSRDGGPSISRAQYTSSSLDRAGRRIECHPVASVG